MSAASGWGRALRLAAVVTVPVLVFLAVFVVALDALDGVPLAEAAPRTLETVAWLAAPLLFALTLLFGLVFGQAHRAARRFAHEGVAMHSAASLDVGLRQGGALVLTGQRLAFVPHRLAPGARPLDVPLGSVREVFVSDVVPGTSGRLVVYLSGGDALAFGVWDPARWADAFAALGVRRADASARA